MSRTDYEIFEQSGEPFGLAGRATEGKRLLKQEELLFDAQEEIAIAMEKAGATVAQLAKGLGKSRSLVTAILSSGRNLTLRTWADIATALGYRVVPRMVNEDSEPSPDRKIFAGCAWMDADGGDLSRWIDYLIQETSLAAVEEAVAARTRQGTR